jgi:hypothetical protein
MCLKSFTNNGFYLIELPLTDRLYTWSSNREEPTLQRIDCAFVNNSWNFVFPNTTVSSLTRFVSDHVPLLVSVSTQISRPAIFRFENAWDQNPICGPIVQQAWNSARQFPNAGKTLVAALKKTRLKLKLWRHQLPTQKFREANEKIVIAFLDHLEEQRNLSTLELNLRRVIISIL